MSLLSAPGVKAIFISEAPGQMSRENIVVTQSGTALPSGTVLTKSGDAAATGSAAAEGTPTGNPTFGTIAIGAAGIPGVYRVRFTAPTKFDVEDPNGKVIGNGTTGVAFSKAGVGFTLTAGGTPAVDGDTFLITVAPGSGKYVAYAAAGAAGPADAVLHTPLGAKTGDSKAVALVRNAELNRFELTGLDAGAITDLARTGLIVRGKSGVPFISTPAL